MNMENTCDTAIMLIMLLLTRPSISGGVSCWVMVCEVIMMIAAQYPSMSMPTTVAIMCPAIAVIATAIPIPVNASVTSRSGAALEENLRMVCAPVIIPIPMSVFRMPNVLALESSTFRTQMESSEPKLRTANMPHAMEIMMNEMARCVKMKRNPWLSEEKTSDAFWPAGA